MYECVKTLENYTVGQKIGQHEYNMLSFSQKQCFRSKQQESSSSYESSTQPGGCDSVSYDPGPSFDFGSSSSDYGSSSSDSGSVDFGGGDFGGGGASSDW